MEKLVDTERLQSIIGEYKTQIDNLNVEKQNIIEAHREEIANKVQEKINELLPGLKEQAKKEVVGEEVAVVDAKIDAVQNTLSLLDSLIIKPETEIKEGE